MRKRNKKISCGGYTLLELMVASVLAPVVILASGVLASGLWRSHTDFNEEEITMNDISLLQSIISRDARDSITGATTNYLEFARGGTPSSSISYSQSKVIYDADIDNAGGEIELLNGAIVSSFVPAVVSNMVILNLEIVESEIGGGKTNIYEFITHTRNYDKNF